MGETSLAGADQLRVEQEAWTMAFLRAYPGLVFKKLVVMKQRSKCEGFVGCLTDRDASARNYSKRRCLGKEGEADKKRKECQGK